MELGWLMPRLPTIIRSARLQFCVKNSITDIIKYNISPNSSATLRKADGRVEAHLIQIACSPVPDWAWNPSQQENYPKSLKKKELRPHCSTYWCIPLKEDTEFIACMKDILDVYGTSYNPKRSAVCEDEKPTRYREHGKRCLCVGAMTGKWIVNIPVMAHAVFS